MRMDRRYQPYRLFYRHRTGPLSIAPRRRSDTRSVTAAGFGSGAGCFPEDKCRKVPLVSIVNFLVGGAARSGSTWIHGCFVEHPAVLVPDLKEVHYFSNRFDEGVEWYEQRFENPEVYEAVGEVSPTYLASPEAPQRIYEYNPDMRLVFVLRDPIARGYSEYCAHYSVGRVKGDIDREYTFDSSYAQKGQYGEQLERYLNQFPREQVHVALLDDLKQDSGAFIRAIFAHIGVDPDFVPSIVDKPINKRATSKRFPLLHRATLRTIGFAQRRSQTINRWMLNLRESRISDVYHKVTGGGKFPELSPEARRAMAEQFLEDNHKIQQLIGRDVSHWLEPYLQAQSQHQTKRV